MYKHKMDIYGVDSIAIPHREIGKSKIRSSKFSKPEDDVVDQLMNNLPGLGLVSKKTRSVSSKSSSSMSSISSASTTSTKSSSSSIAANHAKPMSTNKDSQVKRLDQLLGIGDDKPMSFAEIEKKKELRGTLVDRIDEMRESLENGGVSISGIPLITDSDSDELIANVHEALEQKCERMNNCDMFAAVIEMVATTAEDIFNGKRSVAGFEPDLTGWSVTVMSKINKQRLRNDTIVRSIKEHYGIGMGFNLAFELITSAFITNKSNKKKAKRAADNSNKLDRTIDSAMGDNIANISRRMGDYS